jgi:hypothetical protein
MLSLLSAAAESPKPVEVRFCPASAIRTYPLESRRALQSLLLQNVAVINHDEAPFKILSCCKRIASLSRATLIERRCNALQIAARNCRQRAFFNKWDFNSVAQI